MSSPVRIENAIISCFDKTGLDVFARGLVKAVPGVMIYSTGGTLKFLADIPGMKKHLKAIEEYAEFAEMPGGLVKTLHPMIHAGLLAEAGNKEHEAYMANHGIKHFQLVVVNLYSFGAMKKKGFEAARSHIDIGGPAMIRAAAKNFMKVAVLVSPSQYRPFLESLGDGSCSLDARFGLAKQAFAATAAYEAEISDYFGKAGL